MTQKHAASRRARTADEQRALADQLVADWPPLTAGQRDRLRVLLATR